MSAETYDAIGHGYGGRRRPDTRIAQPILEALGDARTVLNVGAGTGSYEPTDRLVVAVEPSTVMIGQRAAAAAPCVRATAELLPFRRRSFDAAMAILTIHHWTDVRKGLCEMRRTARRVLLVTFDVEASSFWLMDDYLPQLADLDRRTMPTLDALAGEFGDFWSAPLLVPHDCRDGFLGAYWRRPEVYLDPAARKSMSSFSRIDAEGGLDRLASEIKSGRWTEKYGRLKERETLDVGYRLLRWDFD